MTRAARRLPRRPWLLASRFRSQMVGGRSVGRGENLGLHQLHGGAAALDLAFPRLDAEHFRPTRFALKPLSQLVGHGRYLLSPGDPPLRPQLLSCMGWPQQASSPLPPLVTIISVPHLVQKYRFPTWLAKVPPPPRVQENTFPSDLGSRSQSSQWLPGSQACLLECTGWPAGRAGWTGWRRSDKGHAAQRA